MACPYKITGKTAHVALFPFCWHFPVSLGIILRIFSATDFEVAPRNIPTHSDEQAHYPINID